MVAKHLKRLEKSGLIRLVQAQPERIYSFRHSLIQEAAYHSLLKNDRKRLHRAVAQALESAFQERPEETAPLLAWHYLEAGEEAQALKYFSLAADAAFDRYANAEAVALYTQAVQLAQRLPLQREQLIHLYTRRGRALELSDSFAASAENYEEMEALARQRQDEALELAALIARATILVTANLSVDIRLGERLLIRARELAQRLGDTASEAKILWNLMLLSTLKGADPQVRIAYGEQALVLARRLDLRELTAFIVHDQWLVYGGVEPWGRLLARLEGGRALWQELRNLPMLADNFIRCYMACLALGAFDQAIQHYQQAYEINRQVNNLDGQALSQSLVWIAYLERGQVDLALELSEQALAAGVQSGNVTALIGTCAELGWMYTTLGQAERGRALILKALALAEEKVLPLRPWPLVHWVRFLIRGDNLIQAAAAMASLERHDILKRKYGFIGPLWVGGGLAECELAFARKDYGSVLAVADHLIAEMEATHTRYLFPDVLHRKGLALIRLGQQLEALAVLEQARQEAERIGAARGLWPVLLSLAELQRQTGNLSAAEAAQRQAQAIVREIARRLPESKLQAAFLSQPQVQAALAADKPQMERAR